MRIIINLPEHDAPDETITAKYIVVLADLGDTSQLLMQGRSNTKNLAQQLHSLHKTIRKNQPDAMQLCEFLEQMEEKDEIAGLREALEELFTKGGSER